MNSHNKTHISPTQINQVLTSICFKLSSCLQVPSIITTNQFGQSEQNNNSLTQTLEYLSDLAIAQIQNYQKQLQKMEQSLRKHVKVYFDIFQNEIELKLYYQHLEQVVRGLKNELSNGTLLIDELKTEISNMKQKQKLQVTLSNVKNTDEQSQVKIDTITQIKNRLSLKTTCQFYSTYDNTKLQRQKQTLQLRDKRQSLAKALQKLYESPLQRNSQKKKKKEKKSKSKQKSSLSHSQKSLSKNKSGKSLLSAISSHRNSLKQKKVRKESQRFKAEDLLYGCKRNSKN